MENFITVKENSSELVINKSRFIAFSYRVSDDDIAKKCIAELRKKYWDATHVCYGYILASGDKKYSDDSEPSGTAGLGILSVIEGEKLYDTLVAVVRYYGGIKLGVGGLSRAYKDSCAQVLAISEKISVRKASVYRVEIDFSYLNKIQKIVANTLAKTLHLEYNSSVILTVAVAEQNGFEQNVADATCGQAKITLERVEFLDME